MLIVSFRKKTDPSNDTTAVNGKNDEATETESFFIEENQQKDMADKNKPKYKALVRLLKLN